MSSKKVKLKDIMHVPAMNNWHVTEEGQLVITGSVDFTDHVFEHDGKLPVLIKEMKYGRVVLPIVINNGKVHTGTGVEIIDTDNSLIECQRISGFGIGLDVRSECILKPVRVGTGTVHNKFFVTHLDNNKVNLRLLAINDGWVNSNTFEILRYSHASTNGVDREDFRHMELIDRSTHESLDNNYFENNSIEGLTAKYIIYGENVKDCTFDTCRYEKPKKNKSGVYFSKPRIKLIDSRRNYISGGFHSDRVVVETNTFFTSRAVKIRGRLFYGKLTDLSIVRKIKMLFSKKKK